MSYHQKVVHVGHIGRRCVALLASRLQPVQIVGLWKGHRRECVGSMRFGEEALVVRQVVAGRRFGAVS